MFVCVAVACGERLTSERGGQRSDTRDGMTGAALTEDFALMTLASGYIVKESTLPRPPPPPLHYSLTSQRRLNFYPRRLLFLQQASICNVYVLATRRKKRLNANVVNCCREVALVLQRVVRFEGSWMTSLHAGV
ncbi:hypothetical protein C0Q70_02578 [Pomacea canaliculata]|uniref:Uncharacterized protein n=1 Tax=Pomacea canaliculata TaxID=400727 RepID=A0A2T7PQC6_POMCA|nr:hypothetical protein C0Q70_02578 [Pomacea canaliculata]